MSTYWFGWIPSGRALLATVGSATAVGTADCSGGNSGRPDTVAWRTSVLDHGDGDVLNVGTSGTVEDSIVKLAILMTVDDVREAALDRLEVSPAADALAFTNQISADDAELMIYNSGVNDGQDRYERSLGHRLFHDQYRLVAVNTADKPSIHR